MVVYYESIKREPKIRGIKKCRCDERLKLKQRNLRASHTLVGLGTGTPVPSVVFLRVYFKINS